MDTNVEECQMPSFFRAQNPKRRGGLGSGYTPCFKPRQLLKNARAPGLIWGYAPPFHEHIPAKKQKIGWENFFLAQF